MIFKRGNIKCSKCGDKYPEVYEACPKCYPSDFEMTPTNIAIMVIVMIVLGYAIYHMG